MAHFRNINDVRILSDINLYSMLEKKLEWDKAGEKAKMTVNGCSIAKRIRGVHLSKIRNYQ